MRDLSRRDFVKMGALALPALALPSMAFAVEPVKDELAERWKPLNDDECFCGPVYPEFPSRWPTGIEQLDDALGGGLERGSLVIVVGTSGTGKTAFCQRIANTCYHRYSLNLNHQRPRSDTVFLSLGYLTETLKQPISSITANCKIPYLNLKYGLHTNHEWAKNVNGISIVSMGWKNWFELKKEQVTQIYHPTTILLMPCGRNRSLCSVVTPIDGRRSTFYFQFSKSETPEEPILLDRYRFKKPVTVERKSNEPIFTT